MNSCELTASITAVANAIACGRTVDEINLLGVAFTQLGDTLLTIGTQKEIGAKPIPEREADTILTERCPHFYATFDIYSAEN